MSLHEKYLINKAREREALSDDDLLMDIFHDRAYREGMRRARLLIDCGRIDQLESELQAICEKISSSVKIIKGSA